MKFSVRRLGLPIAASVLVSIMLTAFVHAYAEDKTSRPVFGFNFQKFDDDCPDGALTLNFQRGRVSFEAPLSAQGAEMFRWFRTEPARSKNDPPRMQISLGDHRCHFTVIVERALIN